MAHYGWKEEREREEKEEEIEIEWRLKGTGMDEMAPVSWLYLQGK